MKVMAIQMPIKDGDVEANKLKVEQLLDLHSGADLYLLPELWSSGFFIDKWQDIAENSTPELLRWLSQEAAKRKIYLAGSLITKNDEGNYVNRLTMFNREGKLMVEYDKVHLFLPMGEGFLERGQKVNIVEIEGFRIAFGICYDLRFPEMFRKLALKTVDLFLVAAEWPKERYDALINLAAARAIENQCYLLLSNRIGKDCFRESFAGASGLYGPWGPIVFSYDEGAFGGEINLNDLKAAREALNVFDERVEGVDF